MLSHRLAVLDVQLPVVQSLRGPQAQQVPGVVWQTGGGCCALGDAAIQHLTRGPKNNGETGNLGLTWDDLRMN